MGSESLKVVLDKRVNLSPTARAPYFASSFISYGYQQGPAPKPPYADRQHVEWNRWRREKTLKWGIHPTPFFPVLYAVLYSSIIQPYPSFLAKAKQSFLLIDFIHISCYSTVPFTVTVGRPPFFFFFFGPTVSVTTPAARVRNPKPSRKSGINPRRTKIYICSGLSSLGHSVIR